MILCANISFSGDYALRWEIRYTLHDIAGFNMGDKANIDYPKGT